MDIHDIHNISTTCTRTEFVGTAVLDTIGLVISGIDDSLLQQMNVGTNTTVSGFSVPVQVLQARSQPLMMQ